MKNRLRNDVTTLLLRLVSVYVVVFICRVVFYFMNSDLLGPIAWSEVPALLRGSLVFDTISVLYANVLFIVLSLLPLRLRSKGWYQRTLRWIFVAANTVAVIIPNLADSVYFHYAKKRFTAEEFHYAEENTNNLVLLEKFAAENWFLLVLAGVLIRGLWWAFRRIEYHPTRLKHWWSYYPASLAVLMAAAVLSVGAIRGGFTRMTRPIAMNNAAQYTPDHQKASLILSNPFCLIRTWGNEQLSVPDYFPKAELDSIYTPCHYPAGGPSFIRKNVVIFTLESFSAEHSALLNPDLYPDGQGFTPFLDSLMQQGYTFTDAHATGFKSIEALPSILASIPSYKKSFVLLPQSLGEMRALPELLAAEGYETAFFCGSDRGSMGFSAFGTLAGIRRTFSREDYETARGTADFDNAWGIWDEPFLDYMAHTLTTFPEPFFANVFTLSSHHPFRIPAQYAGAFPSGHTRNHQPAAYTDHALRRFFDYATQQAWYENTLFVFVADHVSSEVYGDKTRTPSGNTAIVMFLYAPDGAHVAFDDRVAQQTDLMPTILGMLNYEKPYFAFGRDAIREPERMPVAVSYQGGMFECLTDSLAFSFESDRRLSVYGRSDVFQQYDLNRPGDPVQDSAETLLKAMIEQYYLHVVDKSYVVPATPPLP
ncbi:MAG: LTA synthase family protein [Rikenellaceae bacterium]|nr:LTA synthase family protein [Rikenellaceae bacterium]